MSACLYSSDCPYYSDNGMGDEICTCPSQSTLCPAVLDMLRKELTLDKWEMEA